VPTYSGTSSSFVSRGVLTAAEQLLVRTLPPEKGQVLLKQVRTQLIEVARPVVSEMVAKAAGIGVVSVHHDISTVTGEEVILFTLTGQTGVQDTRKR
jgi:uncharacterized protein YbcI